MKCVQRLVLSLFSFATFTATYAQSNSESQKSLIFHDPILKPIQEHIPKRDLNYRNSELDYFEDSATIVAKGIGSVFLIGRSTIGRNMSRGKSNFKAAAGGLLAVDAVMDAYAMMSGYDFNYSTLGTIALRNTIGTSARKLEERSAKPKRFNKKRVVFPGKEEDEGISSADVQLSLGIVEFTGAIFLSGVSPKVCTPLKIIGKTVGVALLVGNGALHAYGAHSDVQTGYVPVIPFGIDRLRRLGIGSYPDSENRVGQNGLQNCSSAESVEVAVADTLEKQGEESVSANVPPSGNSVLKMVRASRAH